MPDRGTILLVEDNPDDAELTLLAFRKNRLEHQVTVVRDGEQALDYLFARGGFAGNEPRELPRLILLDLKLPKVDGLEVLKAVRDDPRTRRTPVVILTTSDHRTDVAKGYELGVNSYIKKPVDFDDFLSAIKALGHYWLSLNTPPGP